MRLSVPDVSLHDTDFCSAVAAGETDLMDPIISLNEMRERVGTRIFGASWIGGLTDEEYELVRDHGPYQRNVVRSDGSSISLNHIEPCSQRIARKLDSALGRRVRIDAQYVTVDSWIQDHGFPVDPAMPADRKEFNRVVREEFRIDKAPPIVARPRGPKAKILPRVIAEMEADLASGRLTNSELFELPYKELEIRYQASRERCNAALKRIGLRKVIPSNTDKKQ